MSQMRRKGGGKGGKTKETMINQTNSVCEASSAVNTLASINRDHTAPAFISEVYPLPVTCCLGRTARTHLNIRRRFCAVNKCRLLGLQASIP